jgi:hypothetical protein
VLPTPAAPVGPATPAAWKYVPICETVTRFVAELLDMMSRSVPVTPVTAGRSLTRF